MHVLETCTSTQRPISCSQASPTVYVSPAQETSPECPAGPSIAGLDVVTAMLLPLLWEAVSPPALCNSPSGMDGKRRGRGQLLPISDHKSSSTAFLASALRSSDWGGSDHLSTRRKLNLRRVPPGVDPATRSAAMRRPRTKPYCGCGKDRQGPNDNPRQLKLLSADTSRLENTSSQWWSSGMKFSSGV